MSSHEVESVQRKIVEAKSDLDLVRVFFEDFSSHHCDLDYILDYFSINGASKKILDTNHYLIEQSVLIWDTKEIFSDTVWINFHKSWGKKLSSIVLRYKKSGAINLVDWIALFKEYEFEEIMIEAEGVIQLSFSKFNSKNIRDIELFSSDIENYHGIDSLSNLAYNNVGFFFK